MQFEWDTGKASANLRKHGVSFDAAKLVFDDMGMQDEIDLRALMKNDGKLWALRNCA